MSSERRTVSKTGGEKGVKDERYDLIPKAALDEIARVYAFGAVKYTDHNWRRGYEWNKSYAALQRHLTAWWDGEDKDPESGLSHLGHAGFHIFALLVFESSARFAEFDDRYKPEEPEMSTEEVDDFFARVFPLRIPAEYIVPFKPPTVFADLFVDEDTRIFVCGDDDVIEEFRPTRWDKG